MRCLPVWCINHTRCRYPSCICHSRQATSHCRAAAAQCYCPYTQCAAGVAIVTSDGRVFSGGYVESAAYNPGLPPLQAAVVDAIVGGMPSYDQVPLTWRSSEQACA